MLSLNAQHRSQLCDSFYDFSCAFLNINNKQTKQTTKLLSICASYSWNSNNNFIQIVLYQLQHPSITNMN